MADISLKIRADKLKKSLENLAPAVEEELNQAVKNVANAAYTSMVSSIQKMKMDEKNRSDYLRALKFKDLGNDSYVIFLDAEWANKLEDGFGGYSIRDVLLKSTKVVQVGKRAGMPWVQTGKQNQKYAAVPISHRPSKGTGGGDLANDMHQLVAQNSKGVKQKITKIFRDVDGNPISGKVATVNEVPQGMDQNLMGLTKFQKVSDKGHVSSIYLAFRTVSSRGKDWLHPGHKGYGVFKKAEEYVEKELDNIILTVLK